MGDIWISSPRAHYGSMYSSKRPKFFNSTSSAFSNVVIHDDDLAKFSIVLVRKNYRFLLQCLGIFPLFLDSKTFFTRYEENYGA